MKLKIKKQFINQLDKFKDGLSLTSDDTIGAFYNIVTDEMENREMFNNYEITDGELKKAILLMDNKTLIKFKNLISIEIEKKDGIKNN